MTVEPPVDDDRLVDLLSACDDALAAGQLPVASGEMPSDELRPRVERGVAFLVRLQQLRPNSQPTIDRRLDTVDRFVIRRELGRGGFGVVYLAFDSRLGREVALKVPHSGALIELELRQRFQAEAQTAAALDHPNIVSVHEAGESNDICYIVSAYCPGGTLADQLRVRKAPTAPADAAALVETLARAVQYAHDRGILHRDLKPANVLLSGFGVQRSEFGEGARSPDSETRNPVPKIADFGLAKRLVANGPETRTGTFVGTPSYMAPEQAAAGRPVGPAADVYALGAILYEMLAGRPPFEGDGPLDTLEQVRTIEPLPPGRLRPKLPRDLETVCLKCLEKEPGRRYRTADELADDLDRFRSGRPVVARRIGSAGRSWRWAKRRPVVAGLVAALAIAVAGGVGGVVWQWRRAEENALAMRDQRDEAGRQRRRAEADFRRAAEAVREMSAIGNRLFHQRGNEDAGRKIVEAAANFHEGFVAEKGDDPAVLLAAARDCARAAMMRYQLGQPQAAIKANDRAVDLYDRLLAADPDNRNYRLERGKRLRSGAVYYTNWGSDHAAAEGAYAAARADFEILVSVAPDDFGYKYHLANTLMNSAGLFAQTGRGERAKESYFAAIALQRQALEVVPNDLGWRTELTLSREGLGSLLWERERSAGAEALCEEVRESYRKIVADHPKYRDARWFVVRTTSYAGDRAATVGRRADAEREYRAALAGCEQLRREAPRTIMYAAEQSTLVTKLARLTAELGRMEEAEALYRRATNLAERLAADFPDEFISRRLQPATAHLRFAAMLAASGRQDEAVKVLTAARKCWGSDQGIKDALTLLMSMTDRP
jgi:tetratricopeptide (TPR) repeat protein